jgi:hypothetical protein
MAVNSVNTRRSRYNLDLPDSIYDELKEVAHKRRRSVAELVRRFIEFGLIAEKVQDAPDSAVLFREHGELTRIRIV